VSNEEGYRILNSKHQRLLRNWKRKKGPCIICGEREGVGKDHLPPEVLFPKRLRDDTTELLTFPVCKPCNNGASDDDFLFSVLLTLKLNQASYLNNQEPTDPDLLALHNQMRGHCEDLTKIEHRRKLLQGAPTRKDPLTGRVEIDVDKLPVNRTTTKIVKSIYWLHTGGDILQSYNPGWWIISFIDTFKKNFIEKHLMTTNVDVQWNDRFITHHMIGHPENGVGGFILCSLHFYTQKTIGSGMSWYLIASPVNTKVNDESLFDICTQKFGSAKIAPSKQ